MFSSVVYIYLFVFSSAQTSSGAGHISFAYGKDSSALTYYTKYRKQDGGGFKAKGLSYTQALNYDRVMFTHQKTNPELVLQLTSASCDIDQLEEVSYQYISEILKKNATLVKRLAFLSENKSQMGGSTNSRRSRRIRISRRQKVYIKKTRRVYKYRK